MYSKIFRTSEKKCPEKLKVKTQNQCCQLSRWKKNATKSLKTSENYYKQAKKIFSFNLWKISSFHRQNLNKVPKFIRKYSKKIIKFRKQAKNKQPAKPKKYRESPWKQATFRLFPATLSTLLKINVNQNR